MSIIEKIDKFWNQIETYQNLKELFSFLGNNEKKEYARCILKWAASSDNQDRSNVWSVDSAVTQCCKNGDGNRNREVMKQTFGLMKVYGFAELDQNKENILFVLDGIEAGKILSKQSLSILRYEFILSLGWLIFALAFTTLYLETIYKIGILDDLKRILVEYQHHLKDVWVITFVFFLPLLLTLSVFLIRIWLSSRIFVGVKNES